MIAVLLTCFNRKEKTIRCIRSIYEQAQNVDLDIYLCDDGSTDGTSEEVKKLFPDVVIITGNGSLFWNRGMLCAWKEAQKKGYDYYLMVNDDVDFYPNMLSDMLNPAHGEQVFAIVGSTCSAENGEITYGGRKLTDRPLCYTDLIVPNGTYQECDVANWNCFLLTRGAVEMNGLLDPIYEHGYGDYDYSYRLRAKGIPIFVAPNYIGVCETNGKVNPLNNIEISRRKRLRILFSNKGIPPKSWSAFTRRYGGRFWVRTFIMPYVKFIIKIMLNMKINKE